MSAAERQRKRRAKLRASAPAIDIASALAELLKIRDLLDAEDRAQLDKSIARLRDAAAILHAKG